MLSMLRPKSLHNVSSTSDRVPVQQSRKPEKIQRPCHHTRGPCPDNHEYHTCRGSSTQTIGRATPKRYGCPWSSASSIQADTKASPVSKSSLNRTVAGKLKNQSSKRSSSVE